jgi:hypothetical protein
MSLLHPDTNLENENICQSNDNQSYDRSMANFQNLRQLAMFNIILVLVTVVYKDPNTRNAYKILVEKPLGKWALASPKGRWGRG